MAWLLAGNIRCMTAEEATDEVARLLRRAEEQGANDQGEFSARLALDWLGLVRELHPAPVAVS